MAEMTVFSGENIWVKLHILWCLSLSLSRRIARFSALFTHAEKQRI